MADPITFQDQPVGVYPGGTVALPIDGTTVVFAGAGLRIRDVEFFNNRPIQKFPHGASRVLSTDGDIQTITATFAGGFTSDFVGMTNWLSGVYKKGEIDTIRMSAFDSTNMLLGTVVSSDLFISFASPGIAKVTFEDASGGGGGYLLDDFRLSPVPEPGTFLLVGTGVAALVTSRRRRYGARVKDEIHSRDKLQGSLSAFVPARVANEFRRRLDA